MRIAIIGLGEIAQKAYLPLLMTRGDVTPILCTRNRDVLERLARAYRVAEAVAHLDALLAMELDAAFVHTATGSHISVAAALLERGVPVYLDKPMAYSLAEAQELVELAERVGCTLMIGFNRRFAPMYSQFEDNVHHRLVIMQKNRIALPDQARRFVFDDFIHVADTLRFLTPGPIQTVHVSFFQEEGKLRQLTLHLESDACTAIGVMNRESGAVEESLEVMDPGHKWLVRNLDTTVHYENGEERHRRFKDWEPVLYRRGFPQIVEHFLSCVREGAAPRQSARDALESHALCERIVQEIEQRG